MLDIAPFCGGGRQSIQRMVDDRKQMPVLQFLKRCSMSSIVAVMCDAMHGHGVEVAGKRGRGGSCVVSSAVALSSEGSPV